MRRLRAWVSRLGGLTAGHHRDRDLDDEVASHLQLHVDDLVRRGMPEAEARRAAAIRFGPLESVKDTYRDRRGLPLVDHVMRDLRQGIRVWAKSPGFTAVAVLSLALGIGANTAIFSIANSLILRRLPVADPDALVSILRDSNRPILSNPIWESIRARPDLFAGAAAWSEMTFNLASGGEVQPASGLMVSGGFFEVLGVRPAAGRVLNVADDRRGGGAEGAVAVISDAFWRRRFGGEPGAVGTIIRLNGTPVTIVGVTPPEFFGAEVGRTFDVAVPIGIEPLLRPHSLLDERAGWWLRAVARLKAGQTLDQAARGLVDVQSRIRAETLPTDIRPVDADRYLRAPMGLAPAATGVSDLRRAYRDPLTIVTVVVGVVLLIACVNLANLLLGRADARRHEMSVRLALGASRLRLVGQLIVESLLLAVAGGVVGLLFAAWSGRLLVRQLSTATNTVTLPLAFDWRVLAFTSAVAIAAALVFGLAPAWRATRTEPNDALKAHGRAVADGRWAVGSTLVVAQVALSLVLVVGAGLFVRTFTALASVPFGFDPSGLLIVDVNATASARPPAARLALLEDVRDRVRALPGVSAAALSRMTPLAGQWDRLMENPPGLALPEDSRDVYINAIDPEWFGAYGLEIVNGRSLTSHDPGMTTSIPVVVNETFAHRYFAAQGAPGQTIRLVGDQASVPPFAIVGVVRDALYDSMRGGVRPTIYQPIDPRQPVTGLSLTVRAPGAQLSAVSREITAAVGAIDPKVSLTFLPLAERVRSSLARERLLAMLSGFFGFLALALAALGLYGVVAYAVSRRRTEIGIRMALGASSAGVIGLVIRRVAVVVTIGVIAGAALALWASRFIAGTLLFGVQPTDPATFTGAALTLVVVAAISSWLPAHRAARIDPASVLRES